MEKSTKNLLIFGGVLSLLGFGAYLVLRKKDNKTQNKNNILPSTMASNVSVSSQTLADGTVITYDSKLTTAGNVVTISVSGNTPGITRYSFVSPYKFPTELRAIRKNKYGNESGEIVINGSIGYAQGFGDAVISYTFPISIH